MSDGSDIKSNSAPPRVALLRGTLFRRNFHNLRLSTTDEVARELAVLYREVRAGLESVSNGTKLAFILRQLLEARRQVEELAKLDALRRQLAEAQGNALPYSPAYDATAVDADLLPSKETVS